MLAERSSSALLMARLPRGTGASMTLDEARWMARRFAAITGQPIVVCRSGPAEWNVWRSLDAARWLADDGELVLPRALRDPDEVEHRLRFEAARLRGRARLTLLEAALAVRCRRRSSAGRKATSAR